MREKDASLIVTGAAGFIGSCLASFLNQKGFANLILVDDFSREDKVANLADVMFSERIDRENLFSWLAESRDGIDFVFHIGARTDTTEFDYSVHQHLNVDYSEQLWKYCTLKQVPMIYASSAATYGNGELGYNDDHSIVNELQPLNPYGVSKNEFDKWVLQQKETPPFWAGLKFFNVYGPNEYHKGRMASVIFHAYNQIMETGKMKLFRSHRPNFKDGEQLRDFIYVKDLLEVCYWLMENQPASALYNLGTGKARSFNDLVEATFAGMEMKPKIEYIDMPLDIRENYQYFTEANMQKLKSTGYNKKFYSLEEGVQEYVRNYLRRRNYY